MATRNAPCRAASSPSPSSRRNGPQYAPRSTPPIREAKTLDLVDNKIGDEGLRHLGDALARGAAPALKELDLDKNPASKAARKAVKYTLKNHK